MTTHPQEIGAGGLWLNADGDPQVTAQDESGNAIAHGKLGPERHRSVFRKVVWTDRDPLGRATATTELAQKEKLFRIRWEQGLRQGS